VAFSFVPSYAATGLALSWNTHLRPPPYNSRAATGSRQQVDTSQVLAEDPNLWHLSFSVARVLGGIQQLEKFVAGRRKIGPSGGTLSYKACGLSEVAQLSEFKVQGDGLFTRGNSGGERPQWMGGVLPKRIGKALGPARRIVDTCRENRARCHPLSAPARPIRPSPGMQHLCVQAARWLIVVPDYAAKAAGCLWALGTGLLR